MAAMWATNPRVLREVEVTNFVTVVPQDSLRHSSSFFRSLWSMTAEHPRQHDREPTVEAAMQLLQRESSSALRPLGTAPPVFDIGVNDGVVNSARQLAEPHAPHTFGCAVVADHADVLGYYDGVDALVAGPPLRQSVFRSGAGFCDDEFFELYRRVAARVLHAIDTPGIA
jgi:hypothetical protein